MAFSAERLLAHTFPEIRHSYGERDAILYALGIGLGTDPLDDADLAFLDETRLKVLPTMAVTLSSPGMWVRNPDLGIAWLKLLHVGQTARFHRSLPPNGEVIGQARVRTVEDRGEGRGAEVVVERRILDAASGEIVCVLDQTLLLRGNGGFAPHPAQRSARPAPPDRAPDVTAAYQTSPRAALIYRLSGDWNPLHIDPAAAAKAGFARPILHGLASYGIAGWVILKALAEANPGRLASLALRFASPVTPGERLDFDIWQTDETVAFLARVGDRVVLDQGVATLR
jgi:acyl dehydratase